ncbi:hypothetical protein N665_0446s0009 [Sinapis alba]|nr:hypothetical protein N665_0446s0009 [Sinapis alba]
MVFIDLNVSFTGDKIHASVKKELVNQFNHLLSQGRTMTCTNFSLNHSCGCYRKISHLYKISFLSSTRVRSCDDFTVALNGFTPVGFREVLDGTLNPDFLVVSHVKMIAVNGKETEKIFLELCDLQDVRLPMVLWEKFATEVSNAIRQCRDNRVILVFRFGKIKIWKDERSVPNVYNVSYVQLNPDMAEVEEFSTIRMIACQQVERGIVMCTIAAIESDMGWYYFSYKTCAKKVQYEPPLVTGDLDDDDLVKFKIYCPKCKCYDPKLLPKYKLHLVVLDNTGTSKFLLFDHLVVQDADVLPLALQNLVGKTYLFKVEVLRENFVYKHDTFKVNKIITNLDIITEFNTTKDLSSQTIQHKNSVISDAPEIKEGSEQQGDPNDLTTTKRRGGPVVNLEEEFDQNSVTKRSITTRITNEKFEESG